MMRMLTTGSDAARGDGQVAADVGGRRVGATVYAPKLPPNHRAATSTGAISLSLAASFSVVELSPAR